MTKKPKLLGLEPRIVAGIKDYYETTMLDTNIVAGIAGRQSVFNLAVRGLRNHKVIEEKIIKDKDGTWEAQLVEPDNYLLNMGLEQVLAVLENWEINDDLIKFYSDKGLSNGTIKYFQNNRKLDLTIDAIPEGIPLFDHEPFISVQGTFEQCQLPESLFVGIIGYETAVATQASYVNNILDEFNRQDIITLEGGSRRVYTGTALAATRAILAGGFKGTSLEQIAIEYPELTARVGGSSGHSAVLHIGSDEKAFELQLKAYYRINEGDSEAVIREKIKMTPGVGPTFLIDTFDSNKGLEAAIKVMKKYGIQCQVRNDSGDPEERTKHIKNTFKKEKLDKARIMISDDLKPWKIHKLLKNSADFNLLLMGTYMVNPYKLPGPVYKISMDQKELGITQMQPVCKVCSDNPAKGTLPGQLDIYRVIGKNSKADRDVIIARDLELIDSHLKKSDKDRIKLNQRVIERGKLIYDVPDMCQVMENAQYHLGLLKEENKKFRGAKHYPVIISDTVRKIRDDFAKKFRRGYL